jgi:Ca2+-binding RTX toxin-like protein
MPIWTTPRFSVLLEGGTAIYTVMVTDNLGRPYNGTIQWSVGSSGSSALPSVSSADFSTVTYGTASVVNGRATVRFTARVDKLFEQDEYFSLALSVLGTAWTDHVDGAIRDRPQITANFATTSNSVVEGSTGVTLITYTVTLSAAATQAVSISYATQLSSAQASDFTGGIAPSGSILFAAGERSKTFTIAINADQVAEANESYIVSLTSATSGVNLGTARSITTTIVNDDTGAPAPTGTAGNDNYVGTANADVYNGLAGNDTISGLAGNDTLRGDIGNDIIDGGAGDDIIDGGAGTDTATYASATSGVFVNLGAMNNGVGQPQNTGGAGIDTLIGIQNLVGSSFNDSLIAFISSPATRLEGGGGNDSLEGGNGVDTLIGGSGADTIWGRSGQDTMTGGTEADIFVFNVITDTTTSATTCDVITDFQVGVDKIGLSGMDASTIDAGDNTFIWIGTSAISGDNSAGEVGYQIFDNVGTANDYTLVYLDTNNTSAIGGAIRLTGLVTLTANDFIL